MNISTLENICKEVCRSKFDWFKYSLVNNPFGFVNQEIVKDAIIELNVEIGTSVSKKFFKTVDLLTDAQIKIYRATVDYYKNTTLEKANNFGIKHINA